jgi:protein-disulfide isomerase
MQGLREDKLSYLPLLFVPPLVALVVILASSGPFVAEGESFSGVEESAINRTEALLAGIPQHGSALGNPKAPVTLQFFGDLQCPESRQVMLGALPALIRHWVRGGQMRIVYRSMPAETLDRSEFLAQQIAALAAGRQGRMWTFIDLFYREQQREFTNYADSVFLEGIAKQAGVNMWRWADDRESDGWAGTIESDELMAEAKEVGYVPGFLVGPTGMEAHPLRRISFEDSAGFDKAIKGLL